MYIYLNVYKQMTAVRLLSLHNNTRNNRTVSKKRAQASYKMLSTKYVHKSYILPSRVGL